MSWLRRKPLHQRLAEEGGLVAPERPRHDMTPPWGEVGIHGVARPREWDAVGVVDAPGLPGDEIGFVALPNGTLLVEDELPDDLLAPLAEAVEGALEPPYRAQAVRRDEARWAVGARSIVVVELPEEIDGDEIELTVHDGERTLIVDGARSFGSVPALERLAEARFGAYVVHAERLDGAYWEVRVTAL